MKDLQQIKDEVAEIDNFNNWDALFDSCAMYDYGRLESAIDQIAIRYAQEQKRELQAWKESASKILHNIDLQKLGKLLDMQYGTAIDEQLLPHVTKLVHHNRELVAMLERCLSFIDELKNHGITNWSEERELRDLITKHKQS